VPWILWVTKLSRFTLPLSTLSLFLLLPSVYQLFIPLSSSILFSCAQPNLTSSLSFHIFYLILSSHLPSLPFFTSHFLSPPIASTGKGEKKEEKIPTNRFRSYLSVVLQSLSLLVSIISLSLLFLHFIIRSHLPSALIPLSLLFGDSVSDLLYIQLSLFLPLVLFILFLQCTLFSLFFVFFLSPFDILVCSSNLSVCLSLIFLLASSRVTI